MSYERIVPLDEAFRDDEADSVESLRDAWLEQRSSLAESGALGAFNDRLTRRWAIETGIIERIYSLDRGTTEILVARGLDAALVEHGASDLPPAELIAVLQDHREAADYVVDHVTHAHGLTQHLIRTVHGLLTRHQTTVEVQDQFGTRFQTPLHRGQWKTLPNNPRRPDGSMHEYCPPTFVVDEMEQLLRLYQDMESSNRPAVIRAAWLHHRFTQIHPFQDGNGRVARALTAFVFVKDGGFPIVVDRDLRGVYIDALEAADRGELRPLVRLFARLEKQEIEEALSLSEASLADVSRPQEGTLRSKLLAALRDRAREKREAITARRRTVMAKGIQLFRTVVLPTVEQLANDLRDALATELAGTSVRVDTSSDRNRHFFKGQVVHMAQHDGYYCDLDTFHEWSRLALQRPDQTDRVMSEIVISLHSLGRQFTGVLALTAYFARRFLDEEGRSLSSSPRPLAERALSFSYLEKEDDVARRTRDWLDAALNVGIEHIRLSL
jgi:Fic family protein